MRLGERKFTRRELAAIAEEYCASYPVGATMFYAPGPESDTIEHDISELGRRIAAATRVPYRVLFGRDDWDEPATQTLDERINSRWRHPARGGNFSSPPGFRSTRRPRPECNRHDRERWLRKFRVVASVAHDALLGDERGRAIGVLTEMVELEVAIGLCTRPPSRLFFRICHLGDGPFRLVNAGGTVPVAVDPNADYYVRGDGETDDQLRERIRAYAYGIRGHRADQIIVDEVLSYVGEENRPLEVDS